MPPPSSQRRELLQPAAAFQNDVSSWAQTQHTTTAPISSAGHGAAPAPSQSVNDLFTGGSGTGGFGAGNLAHGGTSTPDSAATAAVAPDTIRMAAKCALAVYSANHDTSQEPAGLRTLHQAAANRAEGLKAWGLYLDQQSRSVVLAVAGSEASASDWCANANAASKPLATDQHGHTISVHAGMLELAVALQDEVLDVLRILQFGRPGASSAASEGPQPKLIVTGHSAGAAISGLLLFNILRSNENGVLTPFGERISIVHFGAAVAVDKAHHHLFHAYSHVKVASIVNAGDPVPRTDGIMAHWVASNIVRVGYTVQEALNGGEWSFASLLGNASLPKQEMLPVGPLLLLSKVPKSSAWTLRRLTPAQLQRSLPGGNVLAQHAMSTYVSALESLATPPAAASAGPSFVI